MSSSFVLVIGGFLVVYGFLFVVAGSFSSICCSSSGVRSGGMEVGSTGRSLFTGSSVVIVSGSCMTVGCSLSGGS